MSEPAATRTSSTTPAPSTAPAESAIWLYAVLLVEEPTDLGGLTGVAGERVRVIDGGAGLAAVVGSVPLSDFGEEPLRSHLEDLRWLEDAARAHHRVIDTLARSHLVLPLRFAVLYHDDSGIRTLLDERRAEFTAALDRVAGRTEWGVKAYVDPDRLTAAAAETAVGEQDTEKSPGTAYLLRRKAQHHGRQTAHLRAQELAETIRTALSELAAATARHRAQDARLAEYQGWMILNDSYLVADVRTEELASTVDALRQRFPEVRLELSGPWPPYSFSGDYESGREG